MVGKGQFHHSILTDAPMPRVGVEVLMHQVKTWSIAWSTPVQQKEVMEGLGNPTTSQGNWLPMQLVEAEESFITAYTLEEWVGKFYWAPRGLQLVELAARVMQQQVMQWQTLGRVVVVVALPLQLMVIPVLAPTAS